MLTGSLGWLPLPPRPERLPLPALLYLIVQLLAWLSWSVLIPRLEILLLLANPDWLLLLIARLDWLVRLPKLERLLLLLASLDWLLLLLASLDWLILLMARLGRLVLLPRPGRLLLIASHGWLVLLLARLVYQVLLPETRLQRHHLARLLRVRQRGRHPARLWGLLNVHLEGLLVSHICAVGVRPACSNHVEGVQLWHEELHLIVWNWLPGSTEHRGAVLGDHL